MVIVIFSKISILFSVVQTFECLFDLCLLNKKKSLKKSIDSTYIVLL